MISGQELVAWGWISGINRIKFLGLMLRAQAQIGGFDGLLLPGDHAKGMRAYQESPVLQGLVVSFFETLDANGQHKPIGAVCHGVLLAARSISTRTGRSVLHGRKTTALTWALERSAWNLTRWWARFWDPLYYRTYSESAGDPVGHWSVEAEVKRALAYDIDFCDVPPGSPQHWRKTSGLVRDRLNDPRAAWVVQDGRYMSARWPGDVCTFAQTYLQLLQ